MQLVSFIKLLVSVLLSSLALMWWTLTSVEENGHHVYKLIRSVSMEHAYSELVDRTLGKCQDRICSKYLTKKDHVHFGYCKKRTWPKKQTFQEPKASVCRFINSTGRNPVALASYPGSGNTWVRGLLQEVTGLCTGGVYCDVALRQNGFPGEELRSGTVLVVKTHQTDPRWTGVYYDSSLPFTYYKKLDHIPVYSAAILLVRNPFHAIVAEHNRVLNEDSIDHHTAQGRQEEFGDNDKWNEFVLKEARMWQETIFAYVINNYDHPLLVVSYEELKLNKETELKKMLDFLQVPYYVSMLKSVTQQDYTKYKRKKIEFRRYTRDQEEYVREVILETIDAMIESKQLNFLVNYLHN